jgi:hypothetical protein
MVEMFAIDILGQEIPGTKQMSRGPGNPMVFCGPGIMGLCAASNIALSSMRVGNMPRNLDVGWVKLASVAPAIDTIAAYNPQEYLGRVLSGRDALEQRLVVDALARAKTAAPQNSVLDQEVHHSDPMKGAQFVLNLELVKQIAAHFSELIRDPDFSYQEPLQTSNGSTINTTIVPAAMLQLLAATGPVEACALGAGVAIPMPNSFVASPADAALLFETTGTTYYPLPIVRVKGDFGANESFSAYARPVWTQLTVPPVARAIRPSQPESQDGLAHSDVEIAFPHRARLETQFLVRKIGDGAEEVVRPDSRQPPKAFFAVDIQPPEPPSRISRVIDSQVPLPLTVDSITAKYTVYPRDEFGRWPQPASTECALLPWPVGRPVLLSLAVQTGESSVLVADLRFSWNWTLRRPSEIRFGLRVGADSNDRVLLDLLPEHGASAPAIGVNQPFRVVFSSDPDVNPTISGITAANIVIVPPPASEPSGGQAAFDRSDFVERTYKLTFPIGTAEKLFSSADRRTIAVVADAREVVSGNRQSSPSNKLFALALDPRPPQITAKPWSLTWASRPNPANQSRAILAPPVVTGPAPAGITLWRAHESSLLDYALEQKSDTDLTTFINTIRMEDNLTLRLSLIKKLLDQLNTTSPGFWPNLIKRFAAATSDMPPTRSVEVALPGTQSGLEFFFFTARSTTGVVSDKTDFSDVRAVAVPTTRAPARPALMILPVDDQAEFVATGTSLFIVSAQDEFEPDDVNVFFANLEDTSGANESAADPEELLLPFRNFWHVSVAKAERYVADIKKILQDPLLRFHALFIAIPPANWTPQLFTVALKRQPTGLPADDIVSPRAAVTPILILPVTVPKLSLSNATRTASGVTWNIAYADMPIATKVGRAEVLIEFLPVTGTRVSKVAPLAEIDVQPLQVTLPNNRRITIHRTGTATLEVTTDLQLSDAMIRIVGRDPLDRHSDITLHWI